MGQLFAYSIFALSVRYRKQLRTRPRGDVYEDRFPTRLGQLEKKMSHFLIAEWNIPLGRNQWTIKLLY